MKSEQLIESKSFNFMPITQESAISTRYSAEHPNDSMAFLQQKKIVHRYDQDLTGVQDPDVRRVL